MALQAPRHAADEHSRPHDRSCARTIRLLALAQLDEPGHAPPDLLSNIAQQIHDCCGHHRLKCYRLAYGWTVDQAIEQCKQLSAALELSERAMAVRSWRQWEAGGRPDPDFQDRLSRMFHANPVLLGFAPDYSRAAGTVSAPAHQATATQPRPTHLPFGYEPIDTGVTFAEANKPIGDEDMKRRTLLAGLAALPASRALEEARQRAESAATTTTVNPASVDEWEQAAQHYGTRVLTASPRILLSDLGVDFAEITSHMQHRQPPRIQQGLAHAAARFAGLIAMTVSTIGENRWARRWWSTAQSLADQSQDATLLAWVLGERAVHALYHGDSTDRVIELARQAQQHSSGPRAETMRAYAAEAQALARAGRGRDAVRIAQRRLLPLYEALPAEVTRDNSVYGWPEFRHHFIASFIYTCAGDGAGARQAQAAARPLYPPGHYGSAANLRLHQALLAVKEADPSEGAREATNALLALPPDHRVTSVLATAGMVLDAIPARASGLRPVSELRELVTAV